MEHPVGEPQIRIIMGMAVNTHQLIYRLIYIVPVHHQRYHIIRAQVPGSDCLQGSRNPVQKIFI